MYADELTDSMDKAISETNRRRKLQEEYNIKNNITPKTIQKEIRETIKATYEVEQTNTDIKENENIEDAINRLTNEMINYAQNLEFEKAAEVRDKIKELENFK